MGRTRLLLPFACLLAAATTYLFFLSYCYVGYYNDDAYYIIGARALLRGSFSFLNKPGNPPIVQFLPGYSLLLAPVAWLFPGSLLALQCSTLLFTLGSLVLAWRTLADKLAGTWRWVFLVLAAMHPSVLGGVGNVMAEPAYLCLSLLTLWLYGRWRGRMTAGRAMLVGSLLGFSVFLRPMGAALVAAVVASEWAGGRRAQAARMAAVAMGMFGAWWVRNLILSGLAGYPFAQGRDWAWGLGGSKEAVASSFLGNTAANIRFYFFAFAEAMFRPCGIAMAAVYWAAVWRGIAMLRRETATERWYALCFLGILALWITDLRYTLPLSPILTFFFVKGLETPPRAAFRPWVAGLAAWAVLGVLSEAWTLAGQASKPNRFNTPAAETFSWVRENTPRDAVLLCAVGGRTHLYTGRKTQDFSPLLPPGLFADFLSANRISHVLLSREEFIHNPKSDPWKLTIGQAEPYLRDPNFFKKVYENPREGTLVLKLMALPSPAGNAAVPAPPRAPLPR